MNKWFYVMDMHSGGTLKTAFEMYFIEAADLIGHCAGAGWKSI